MSGVIIVTQADAAILERMRLDEPLRRELRRAVIVCSEAVPPDVATMNSQVRYTDVATGISRTVALVYGPVPRYAGGLVSVLEPLGAALLGLSAGQSIEWVFPDGTRRRVRLDAVLYQPENARRRGPSPSRASAKPASSRYGAARRGPAP